MTNLIPNVWDALLRRTVLFIAGWCSGYARRIFLSLALVTVASVVIKAVAHRTGFDLYGTFLDGTVDHFGRWDRGVLSGELRDALARTHHPFGVAGVLAATFWSRPHDGIGNDQGIWNGSPASRLP